MLRLAVAVAARVGARLLRYVADTRHMLFACDRSFSRDLFLLVVSLSPICNLLVVNYLVYEVSMVGCKGDIM